jgi:hypothetical protein
MKLGIDVGSTTVKLVVLNDEDQIIYSKYERHMSDVFDKVQELIIQMKEEMGDLNVRPVITGSGGGIGKACACRFKEAGYDVFMRGSASTSCESSKTLVINGLRMLPQEIWLAKRVTIDLFNKQTI